MKAHEARSYARVAGFLLLVSLVAGGFGESYVPGKLIAPSDVVETARRVGASIGLFRASFASYLVEAACDLALTAIFYVLLEPVNRTLSLIAACFGVFSTATFAVGEIFYFIAGLSVTDADIIRALNPDAHASFTFLCLLVYRDVFAIFAAFYGVAVLLRGYLTLRSGYLPRLLGGLVLLGGTGLCSRISLRCWRPNTTPSCS